MNDSRSQRVRPEFRCHNCNSAFEATIDLAGVHRFLEECPYCNALVLIDLGTLPKEQVALMDTTGPGAISIPRPSQGVVMPTAAPPPGDDLPMNPAGPQD